MKKFLEYTYIESKVLFRIPIVLFFTILFPQILLALFSSEIIAFAVSVAGNRSKKLWQTYRLRGLKLSQIVVDE